MFAIRRIYDHINPVNQMALLQCKDILLSQFPYLTEKEADQIFLDLENPLAIHFRYLILVAEGRNKNVLGVAIGSYFPKENFYFLDYIASHRNGTSGGLGGALFARMREEALNNKAIGIFLECLTDDAKYSADENERQQNISRLRFYERYEVRPLEGTMYEEVRKNEASFHLLFDGLGEKSDLSAVQTKKIIQAILENKHPKSCSAEYVEKVLKSIPSPTVKLSPPRFKSREIDHEIKKDLPSDKKIALIFNEGHIIHHVKERGYLESPVRVTYILKELNKLPIFETIQAHKYPEKHLEEVHDPNYLKFLKKICETIGNSTTRYGDVFPIRNAARLPNNIELQIGYYCIDTSTPLNANAYIAAREAVNCALTGAQLILNGKQMAYALVRPPGHHAEKKHFGGFCYLNSTAIAANFLSKKGKVAILDIDYHHGNGQQNIFYKRKDVYTVSIHGDPTYAYPYFTGFADEEGEGEGKGYNLNIPLKPGIEGKFFHKVLGQALEKIKEYNPTYLIIALGLDVAKDDPSGTWRLLSHDFMENGKMVSSLNLPLLVIQEGGYVNKALGHNARCFFEGLWGGYYKAK